MFAPNAHVKQISKLAGFLVVHWEGHAWHNGKSEMADDRSKRSGSDRAKVAAGQKHEVDYFAKKHGLTREQTLDLIKKHGNDRKTLEAAVHKLKDQ